MQLIFSVAIASLALGLSACGAKPKPKPAPPTTDSAPAGPTSAGPEAPSEPTPERTRGGVELGMALDSAGEARERVFLAAQALSKDRADGVAKLIAEKAAAKATVLALFESKNLDELIGALLVLQAEGDPTGARADGAVHVLALLDHEVGAVRDAAWETAAKVADGAALAGLLPTLPPDGQLAVVRLLAAWDGEPVQAALWGLVTGPDADLAIEAALALSAPGKTGGPAVDDRLATMVKDASDPHLRLALIVHRRFALGPAAAARGGERPDPRAGTKIATAIKGAIDRALVSQDEALVLEGVRSTLVFPPEEREPLYEQLALDPRPAVRAVTAEVLARHGRPLAASLLDKLLADADGDVRMAAASARSRVGPAEERVKALEALLVDGHRGVRLAAAVSMALPDLVARCTAALVKHLEREDSEGRKSILGALTSSGNRTAIAAVIDLLSDADTKRVVAAHFALTTASKLDFETDIGAWKAWLDKTYPPPPAPPAPAAPTAPKDAPKPP